MTPEMSHDPGARSTHATDSKAHAWSSHDRSRHHAHASHDDLALAVQCALDEGGAVAALALLNARTRFRYTGAYRLEEPLLRNVALYDRENPGLNLSGDASPLEATYCSIVCATNAAFETPDAAPDARLAGHPAVGTVLSYCGVPLQRSGGIPWGSLCHWDTRPRLLSPDEREVLQSVAPLVARWLIARDAR